MDGTVFSDNFAEVAPPAREDSEVKLSPGQLQYFSCFVLFSIPSTRYLLSLICFLQVPPFFVTQIRGHILEVGTPPPHYGACLRFSETNSALFSLVDSHRIVHTHAIHSWYISSVLLATKILSFFVLVERMRSCGGTHLIVWVMFARVGTRVPTQVPGYPPRICHTKHTLTHPWHTSSVP